MDYSIACTNCGEANYRKENDLSFITGRAGFHVCNNCGFNALQFPKMARVEIENLKKRFNRHPKHFFKKEEHDSTKYFWALFIICAILLGISLMVR